MVLLKTTANGVFWTSASTLIRSIVNILQYSILARFLAKDEFGIIAIASLFIAFTQIFLDMGISSGILHKQDIKSKDYSSLYWLNIFTGLFLTGVLVMCSRYVSEFYGEPSLYSILSLLSLTILFSSIGSQHRIVLQKQLKFSVISCVEIVASLSILVSVIVLVFSGVGIYSLVFSTLIGSFVANFAYLIIGVFRMKNVCFHFSLMDTYPFLKIGIFSMGSQVLDFFSREVDTMIISIFLSKDQLGVYSLLKKLVTAMFSMISSIVNSVLTPLLSKIQFDVNNLRKTYYRLIESMSLIIMPVFFLVACFSHVIVYYVYGSQFCTDSIILCLSAVYYAFLIPGTTITPLQIATGRTDSGFYWTIVRIIINSVTLFCSVRYGIIVMILSLLLVNILFSPISWMITIKPLIGGFFIPYFKNFFIPYLIFLVLTIPVCYLMAGINNLVVNISVMLVVFFIYAILFFTIFKKSYVANFFIMSIKK